MSALSTVSAGGDILASWGSAVTTHLNGPATLSAATGNITNTQTQVVAYTIAANSLVVGDVFHVKAMGVCTSSVANIVTIRIRIGSTTLTGNIATANIPTATTTASADPFWVEGHVTVRSIGASGTVHGGQVMVCSATQPFASATRPASGDPAGSSTSTVVVDTTATKLIELTVVTAAATTSVNFLQASITKIRP